MRRRQFRPIPRVPAVAAGAVDAAARSTAIAPAAVITAVTAGADSTTRACTAVSAAAVVAAARAAAAIGTAFAAAVATTVAPCVTARPVDAATDLHRRESQERRMDV